MPLSRAPQNGNSCAPCKEKFLDFLKSIPQIDDARIQEIHKKLTSYEQLLQKENVKFNLISQHDIENLWIRHFQDSLIPIQIFHNLFPISNQLSPSHLPSSHRRESKGNLKTIDVGSGAGLPGIPLSIALPDSEMTLLESSEKKCHFLRECIDSLSLKNVVVVRERSENLAHDPTHREQYDFSIARAVAKPASVLELLLPFVKIGGKAIFWASGEEWNNEEKIESVSKILGGRFFFEKEYILPEDENARKRKIVLIEKTKSTDKKYSRRIGIPQKRPLS